MGIIIREKDKVENKNFTVSELNIIDEAKEVFDIEIESLKKVRDNLGEEFVEAIISIMNCKGKVIVTGMGKSGHIARKIAATFASLGTSSFFLHPAEALHGDLGMIEKDDLVISISYSGESQEINNILPNIKIIGAKIIGITGNENSTLAKNSDILLDFPKFEEACALKLAPTSSTTASMVIGDALAVITSKLKNFQKYDFALFHPSGSLGKKLLVKVKDIMFSNDKNAIVQSGTSLQDAIVEMCAKGLSVINVVDDKNKLVGILTDGDLRRLLQRGIDVYSLCIDEVMTKEPKYTQEDIMAVEAIKIMNKFNITAMPVLDEDDRVVGTIRLQEILNEGIYNED